MIDEKIDERELNDMVDVILVYGQATIIEPADISEDQKGKDERTLREWQKEYPKISGGLRTGVIAVFNKHKLDEEYKTILTRIPSAVDLSKEYKNRPGDET